MKSDKIQKLRIQLEKLEKLNELSIKADCIERAMKTSYIDMITNIRDNEPNDVRQRLNDLSSEIDDI
jgi:hypothetical protein